MIKIKIGNILFNILAIITAIAVAAVAFNLITGTKCYAVTSNSMAEKLVKGDAVFSKPESFDKLKIGDIITVKVGNYGYFTHRIVEVDAEKRTVTTKGDANDAVDPMPTSEENIVGKMIFSVPYLGYLSFLMNGNTVIYVLIALVITAAVLIAANTILQKKKMRGDING